MTKTLTPKQEYFLEALLGEARGNIRAAMDMAGYSKSTKTTEVLGPLKEEITEKAGMMLAMNAPKAAFGSVDVLNDPLVLIPDPKIIRWVEDALDRLDQGNSTRRVAAWLVEKTGKTISQ